MTTVAYIAYAIAGLWIVSLITLALEFSGREFFGYVSAGASILAGVGMIVLVLNLRPSPFSGLQAVAAVAGVAGGLVNVLASVLVISRYRSFEDLSGWVLGGLAVFGVWFILIGVEAPEAMRLTSLLRILGIAVGIGFILLEASVLTVGPVDPTASERPTGLMATLQIVGGGVAYVGFPAWLIVFALRLL